MVKKGKDIHEDPHPQKPSIYEISNICSHFSPSLVICEGIIEHIFDRFNHEIAMIAVSAKMQPYAIEYALEIT